MKKLLFIFSFFIVVNSIDAQFLKSQKDMTEIRLNKNHLELDIKNIFSGLSGASLIYKRRLESAKYVKVNSLNLLRIFGTFSYNIEVTHPEPALVVPVTDYVPDDYSADFFSNKIGLGLEWQKMNKGFVHYVGSDLIIGYDRTKTQNQSTTSQGGIILKQIQTKKSTDTYSAGLNPFFGIKYYFNSQLHIGIETGIYFGYQLRHINTERSTLTNTNGVISTVVNDYPKQNNSSIITSLNGLRFLTVGYCF